MRNAEGENKVIESQAPNKTRLLYKPIVQILLIVVTGLIAYSNTFRVPFQFDDYNYIIDNHKLRDLSNLWPPTGSRWAGFLTFALNYKFGGLSVTDYHIVNIIIHIINALLVYRLVLLTFQTPYFNLHPSTFNPRPSLIALFSSLLFVSHPVQTQAVTYIVQRFTSTAVMFYLLSLVMYVKFRTQNTEHRTQSTDKRQKIFSLSSVFWYLGSVLSAVLAMKTKEIAFTLPFIIVLYEFSFFTLNSECKIPPHPPLSKG
ncbi:MAG: hypothetical protein HZA10_09595 [Nitrospirae bacterium]|nr:hypothetical protein [Nitrospirota bacterium]